MNSGYCPANASSASASAPSAPQLSSPNIGPEGEVSGSPSRCCRQSPAASRPASHSLNSQLRTGELAGNHFRIRVRDLEADSAALAARWQALANNGCPNYFGRQRFGRDGANLEAAAQLDPQRLKRPRERARSGML
ncbi:tRNA pseudouridine(13) synthase TruD, partial [Halobacillus litoralis]|nr:tRNA pseudouridine(13) synthase TruD [Halobacillus litoralis]